MTRLARFSDGEISCDAILGNVIFPVWDRLVGGWLAQKKLDVLPWRNALQLHHPPRWILVSKATFRPFENNLDSENGEPDVSVSPRDNNKKKKCVVQAGVGRSGCGGTEKCVSMPSALNAVC